MTLVNVVLQRGETITEVSMCEKNQTTGADLRVSNNPIAENCTRKTPNQQSPRKNHQEQHLRLSIQESEINETIDGIDVKKKLKKHKRYNYSRSN